MNKYLLGAGLLGCLLGVFFTTSYATVGGQYSVNVHFVPPLVTAPCNIAQFWMPPNVTCAMCFCMTGSLSRCIPQPGCSPQAQNSTTTPEPGSNSTTAAPPGTGPTAVPSQPGGANQTGPSPAPAGPSSVPPPTEAPMMMGGEETPTNPPARHAKPGKGKSRRRRHSN